MLGCQDACQVINKLTGVFCSITGVTRRGQLWKAVIRVSQRSVFLGLWWTEEQAGRAYDQAAIAYGVRSQACAQLSASAECHPIQRVCWTAPLALIRHFDASSRSCPQALSEHIKFNLHLKKDHMQGRRSLNFPADYTLEDRTALQAKGGEAVAMQLQRQAQEKSKMRCTSRYDSIMIRGC